MLMIVPKPSNKRGLVFLMMFSLTACERYVDGLYVSFVPIREMPWCGVEQYCIWISTCAPHVMTEAIL
jgi:hypothetical protein